MSYIGRLSRLLPPPLHGSDVEPAGVNCLPPRAREKGRIAFVYTLWVGLAGEWRGKGRKIAGAAAAAASLLIMGGGSGGFRDTPQGAPFNILRVGIHPIRSLLPVPFLFFLFWAATQLLRSPVLYATKNELALHCTSTSSSAAAGSDRHDSRGLGRDLGLGGKRRIETNPYTAPFLTKAQKGDPSVRVSSTPDRQTLMHARRIRGGGRNGIEPHIDKRGIEAVNLSVPSYRLACGRFICIGPIPPLKEK